MNVLLCFSRDPKATSQTGAKEIVARRGKKERIRKEKKVQHFSKIRMKCGK
jgi:hypothetical protein